MPNSFELRRSTTLTSKSRTIGASEKIEELCKQFLLSDIQISQVMTHFLNDVKLGLGKKTNATSTVKCLVTYIQDLPTGRENGRFLAIDLAGVNFRVVVITLGEKHFDMLSKVYAVPHNIMRGSGSQLFDHVAKCLANFITEHSLRDVFMPLGLTFSFPIVQRGLAVGILQRWTHNFNCSGVVGENVVLLLQRAIARRKEFQTQPLAEFARKVPKLTNQQQENIEKLLKDLKVSVCAIVNDAVGTLISCAWLAHDTRMSIIMGIGTNACYVERVERAELFEGRTDKPYVIINTKCANFGEDGKLDFLLTEFDKEVDDNSSNPGKHVYEKLISGIHMGELVRLVLVKAVQNNLLFKGKGSDLLNRRGNFATKYVSEIESDKEGDHTAARQVVKDLRISNATDQDLVNIRRVCEVISTRAGHLTAAITAVLLNKMAFPNVTIAVDGSMYRYHPGMHDVVTSKIQQLIKPNINFNLMLAEDGSGRGAALVAAVASERKFGRLSVAENMQRRISRKSTTSSETEGHAELSDAGSAKERWRKRSTASDDTYYSGYVYEVKSGTTIREDTEPESKTNSDVVQK